MSPATRLGLDGQYVDYTANELLEILRIFCDANEYQFDAEAELELMATLSAELAKSKKGFGNGRYVRNLFERAMRNHAVRLHMSKKPWAKEDLITLSAADFKSSP